jgi:hypothetical protein
MNVIDWKTQRKDVRGHFLETLNQRKFLCHTIKIHSKSPCGTFLSILAGIANFTKFRTNIELVRSNRVQRILFLGRKESSKKAR